MATKVWESIIPKEERKRLKNKEPSLIRQCLVDLGYLNWGDVGDFSVALIAFRKDCQQEKLLSKKEASSRQINASLQEEQLLKNLLTLEGDFPVFQLPSQGALTLSVRLLHYRLHLLGFYPLEKIGQPFSPLSLDALHQFGKQVQLPPDSPDLLILSGHFLRLIHHLNQKGNLDKKIVAFKFSASALSKDLQKETKEERGKKENPKQLIKTEKACDQELKQLENKILDKELAERKRLEDRKQNKHKRLLRINRLLRKIHADFKKSYQSRLKEKEALNQKINEQVKGIKAKEILLKDMESNLAQAKQWPLSKTEKKEKKKQLKEQIKARKKILKAEQKTLKQLEKELKTLIQQQQKEEALQQQKLKRLQTQLKELRTKVNGLRFRFKGQLKRSLDLDFYQKIQKTIFSQEDQKALAQTAKAPFNLFLIRVIQLHQWTNGYYNGRLDSEFAGKTFGAIAEMTDDIPRLRLKYILAALGKKNKGYWVLNIHYLMERFCQLHPLNANPPKQEAILAAYQENFKSGDSGLYNKTTNRVWKENLKTSNETTDSSLLPRRVYHGHPTLLRAFGRVMGRIGKIIWKGLKITFQVLENFVRMLYEDIRESVVLFVQSLDFLFGKRRTLPMGERDIWDTPKYVYDDALSVEDNAEAAEQHFQKQATDSNLPAKSINNTLKILKQVATFAIALATGGITWPALLTKLILFCRRWFFRWLREVLLERRRELFAV